MFNAAVLKIIEEAGIAVLTLTEGLEKEEFLRSRITRSETSRHLFVMGTSLAGLPGGVLNAIPEIDWQGWQMVGRQLGCPGTEQDDAAWFAVQSLVPATLMWLRVYQQNDPELFSFSVGRAS